MSVTTGLVMLLSLTATALSTARMELPAEFESQAERISSTGIGGGNKGSYSLGLYQGEFKRSESRLGIFDPLYVSNMSKASFTFQEGDSAELLSADCKMKKGAVTSGVVTFDLRKMAYQCDFRSGGDLLGARLVLGQPKSESLKESFLARDTRRGEAVIFDTDLTFRSVHKYKGTKLQSQALVGYWIEHDERVIAAVELTDVHPGIYLLSDTSGDLKRAALVVAVALALLRDPADSGLED